jgi:hypothetical protein
MNMMTMQFNSSRRVIPQQQPNNIPPTPSSFMGFSAKYRRIQPSANYQSASTSSPSSSPTVSPSVAASTDVPAKPKSMKWGEPVWLFLHTMAEKIREDSFSQIKDDFLKTIVTICANLPCPDCANHATQYMRSVNFNTIQTKKDLKDMLFRFHNTVNKKKGFPIFPYDQLDEKYSAAVTINIVRNFVSSFQQKNYSIRMIANDFHRSRAVSMINDWLNKNLIYFSP